MFEVCAEKCDQCLFSKNRIVRPGRMQEILKDCAKKDTHFVCHKASIAGRDTCCKGFYDTQTSQLMRIAQRLKMVKFVDPTTGEHKNECSDSSN
jgi:hypothetical protein